MERKKSLTRKLCGSLLAICFFAVTALPAVAADGYTFAPVPQQDPAKLFKLWKPMLDYLSKETGEKISFKTAPSIPEFSKQLRSGEYDFAYANPLQYVVANEEQGYEVFGNAEGKKIKGLIVVKKDSPLQSLQDLEGKTVSFPSPNAFGARIIQGAEFKRLGITINEKFTKTHDNGYIGVAKGAFDACGGVGRTFKATNPKVKEELRVLWTSPGNTPHALCAHKRVPKDLVAKVQKAMVAMKDDPELSKLLKDVMKIKGVQAVTDAQYQDIRDMAPNVEKILPKDKW